MLEVLLGSKTRAGVLRCLFLEGRSYRLLELQRAVGTSISSVQKELVTLEALGLVRSERVGDARTLSAVTEHPLAPPLNALFEADAGIDGVTFAEVALPALNPAVAPKVADIVAACRRNGVVTAALVGSATQADGAVAPADLDVLVRFEERGTGHADRYFSLLHELEQIMGMPVEIIEEDGVRNPYLRKEFDTTKVVLYAVA